MSSAIEAATHTVVPTMRAVALPSRSVHPNSRKMRLVPSSVAMAMPEVGFEVTPTSPTMRALTVTKKNAKTAIKMDAMARIHTASRNPSTPGTSVSIVSTSGSTISTVRNDSSTS